MGVSMSKPVLILPGDPAPAFTQRAISNPRYVFSSAAGRYLVLCFLGSAADAHAQAVLAAVKARTDLFDDAHASFFGVSVDPADEAQRRVQDSYPGTRFLWDFDLSVSKLYGAVPIDAAPSGQGLRMRRTWVVIDPTLRVLHVEPFRDDRSDIQAVLDHVAKLPPPARYAGVELQAPIILLPNVFEPAFCAKLIALYQAQGGQESGFMREENGRTVLVNDHAHKRRRDVEVTDRGLIGDLQARIVRRVVPEIAKVHQFQVTRMERYLVACYSAAEGGHFRAHRDNTTKGTAHRRFAVSINLNAEFEGGEVSFPEYGPRGFKPPPGGAVVFSCSLLHQVSKVTAGERYAFLPFLYDDAAAKIREENIGYLGDGTSKYAAGATAG
jgi:peroxiredoxin/predicted 2-oxoglutarate/Fe(II)-dependent dioxygenase YbiX